MKKVSIEITDETHLELLKMQLDQTVKNNGQKVPIAKVIANYLEEMLVKQKAEK